MSLYRGHTIRITAAVGETQPIQVAQGVLQGDTLSPLLFELVMDFMLRRALNGINDDLGLEIAPRREPGPGENQRCI